MRNCADMASFEEADTYDQHPPKSFLRNEHGCGFSFGAICAGTLARSMHPLLVTSSVPGIRESTLTKAAVEVRPSTTKVPDSSACAWTPAMRNRNNAMHLCNFCIHYFTVTLFASFRGWSTSQPRRTAMW